MISRRANRRAGTRHYIRVAGKVRQLCLLVHFFQLLKSQKRQVALLSQRGRAMLHVYQLASIVQYVERNVLLLVTSASGSPLRKIKFCSVLFRSSWSSILAVINKIRCCVAVCAVNWTVDRRNCCSHVQQSPIRQRDIGRDRDFCLSHLHSTPLLVRFPSVYRHNVWRGKKKPKCRDYPTV